MEKTIIVFLIVNLIILFAIDEHRRINERRDFYNGESEEEEQ